MFWNNKKKYLPLLEVIPKQQREECEKWMKELGVSSQYTRFKAFEDPILVEDAMPLPVQEKMERIMIAQWQTQAKRDINKLVI